MAFHIISEMHSCQIYRPIIDTHIKARYNIDYYARLFPCETKHRPVGLLVGKVHW